MMNSLQNVRQVTNAFFESVQVPSQEQAIDYLIQQQIFETAVEKFGEILSRFERSSGTEFSHKEDGSLVSNLEKEVEGALSSYLIRATPWAAFQGEEGTFHAAQCQNSCFKWYVDPIDGTISFKNGWDTFGLTLTLVAGTKAVATVIRFPRRDETYLAFEGRGATLNSTRIEVNSDRSKHAVFAVSDSYTFAMTGRKAVLSSLHELPCVVRTVTDIYGYCQVARGACSGKFDAAGALWDLLPGHLLIQEAGGHCRFFPVENPSEELAGSMLIGSRSTVDWVMDHLRRVDRTITNLHTHLDYPAI